MCPLSPVPVPLDIDTCSDEERLLFLARRQPEDSIPPNVIIEVDPFSIRPLESPEDVWYMYKLDDKTSSRRGDDRYGYWEPIHEQRIAKRNTIIGRKITLEFYEGKAPSGSKTGWVMQQYLVEQEAMNGSTKTEEYNSLCRLSLQVDRHENPNYSDMSSGHVEQFLFNILEPEESNSPSQDAADRAKTVPVNEKGQSMKSNENLGKPLYENSVEDTIGFYDFSKEDYLELNDLFSHETSSASSENASRISIYSDAYFDADALRREIESDLLMNAQKEHADCKFSSSEMVKSSQVILRPPSLVTVQRHGDLTVQENRPVNSLVENRISSQGTSSATNELNQNRKATSGRSGSIRANRIVDSSRNRSKSEGNGFRSVSKIAKLGKRYCCLGSFSSDAPPKI